jgi:hypothetical protein
MSVTTRPGERIVRRTRTGEDRYAVTSEESEKTLEEAKSAESPGDGRKAVEQLAAAGLEHLPLLADVAMNAVLPEVRAMAREAEASLAQKYHTSVLSVPDTGLSHYLSEAVYAVMLVVTVDAWTVLGFAVWLPLLVRTTTLLAGSIFYAGLFRDQARVINAQRSVHFAVRFYVRGFEHFLSFYRQRAVPDPPVGLFEPQTTMK